MFRLMHRILLIDRNEVVELPALWPSGLVKDPPGEDGQRGRDDRSELLQNPSRYLVRASSGINVESGETIESSPGPDRNERLLTIGRVGGELIFDVGGKLAFSIPRLS